MKRLLFILLPLVLCAAAAHSLDVKGYEPAVNDRFSSGYPNAPVPSTNPKFAGQGYDWSGVGWWKKDAQYSVTLLSARNFTYTKHEAPQVGDTITFLGRDGHLHDYHVAKLTMIPLGTDNGQPSYADCGIGTFAESVPFDDQVTHYPVAFSSKGLDGFTDKKILMYGHMARIGFNSIVEGIMLDNVASEYNFNTSGLSPGMAKVEVGDSGSPAFMVVNGKLALVGTHWKIDTDCMVSGLIASMNKIMAADGTRLDVVPVDP